MLRWNQISLAVLLATAICLPAAGEQIKWASNLESAINQASRQNQLVLIHFWTPWCGPCRLLERNVFSRGDVASAIHQHYVPVKVNAEAMPDIAQRYNVDRFPMDVVITPAGYKMHTMVSPQDPQKYMTILNRLAASRRPGTLADNGNSLPGSDNHFARGSATEPAVNPMDNRFAQGRPAQDHLASNQVGGRGQWQDDSIARDQSDNRFRSDYEPRAAEIGNRYAEQYQQDDRDYGQSQRPRSRFTSGPSNDVAPPERDAMSERMEPRHPAAEPRVTQNPYIQGGPRRDFQQGAPRRDGPSPVGPPHAAPPRDAAASAPVGKPPMGLDGFCPVTLVEKVSWQRGDPHWGIIHRGRTYLFTSEAAKQTFWSDPDRFAPILSGNDPVEFANSGRLVMGIRKHGVFYRDRIFLFSSEQNLQQFWKSPQTYADVARQAMSRAQNQRR